MFSRINASAAPLIVDTTAGPVLGWVGTAGHPQRDGPLSIGNRDLSDFSTYPAAKAWFDTYFPYHGDVARLDGDNDGEPCESLPGGP